MRAIGRCAVADGTSPKQGYSERVAQEIIAQIEAGTAPWQKPWDGRAAVAGMPFNPTTGKRYRGMNTVYLMCKQPKDADPEDTRWMTYNQAKAKGWQVKAGEKGQTVEYWMFDKEEVDKATGKKVRVKLDRPKAFWSTVFHASQIEGIPAFEAPQQTWASVERAERLVLASQAYIQHRAEDRAFYSPGGDHIVMPERSQFHSAEHYWSTLLHELGHWTGHKSRLDRDLTGFFGSESYAKEELRAEIASLMLCAEMGIGHDGSQHAAYVKSWVKVLQDDPREIFRAAASAEKIQEFLLAFEQKQEQDHTEAVQVDASDAHTPSEPLAAMALPTQAIPESDSAFRLSTEQRAQNTEWQAEALRDIQAAHKHAVQGYSPLDTWNTLQARAAQFGLVAQVALSDHLNDPTVDDRYTVHYFRNGPEGQDGTYSCIRSLFGRDGKAITEIYGERVPGTFYSPSADEQVHALDQALAVDYHLRQPVQLHSSEMSQTSMHPVMVLHDVAGILRNEHTGYAGGSDRIANAESYLRSLAHANAGQCAVVANHWREHIDGHSLRTGLSSSRVYQLGRQLGEYAEREQARNQEALQERTP